MSAYTVEDEAAIDVIASGDLIRVYDLSTKAYRYASIDQMRTGAATVVVTTATTLAITATSHAGKSVVINSTSPIAITLPQATGTGNRFRFIIGVVATATGHTIKVANATDNMNGGVSIVATSATDIKALAFAATATDDTITVNGTTQAGTVGTQIDIEDAKTGLFAIRMTGNATGSYATPFSATV